LNFITKKIKYKLKYFNLKYKFLRLNYKELKYKFVKGFNYKDFINKYNKLKLKDFKEF
jgi:hypothetical protein